VLAERRGQCGIVYARLRATCDWLAGRLEDAGLDVAAYHAGKDSQQRSRVRRGGWGGGGRRAVAGKGSWQGVALPPR
jgi:superfamily II DNA helicase RecQ